LRFLLVIFRKWVHNLLEMATLTDFPELQVLVSLCPALPNQLPYWLFGVYRKDIYREYRLPEVHANSVAVRT
jgi:hypothetical protein